MSASSEEIGLIGSQAIASSQQLLRIVDVSKSFGSTRVLSNVSLDVQQGSVHALLGGNGSGKSTLIKILAGVHSGESGHVERGMRVAASEMTPQSSSELGLRFVHQDLAVFGKLSVADNLALGIKNGYPTSEGIVARRELNTRAEAILANVDLDISPRQLLGDLRPADQTMVAVARALADVTDSDVRTLVLDEPTAALPDHEVEILLAALRICVQRGHGILYVSHRLDEVLDVADEITILRDGARQLTARRAELTKAQLIEGIAGRTIEAHDITDSPSRRDGREVLRLTSVTVEAGPVEIDLVVREGEIVGLAGLQGAGQNELLAAVIGVRRVQAGLIEIAGRPMLKHSPDDAMRTGAAFVPGNRAGQAAFLNQDLTFNLTIASLAEHSRGPFTRPVAERQVARSLMNRFRIKADGIHTLMSTLSGGNQQKAVLARLLARDPRLLLLEEPTQGVDVGARAELHDVIRAQAGRGMGVLVASSDFDELATLCHRVVVLRGGHVVGDHINAGLTAVQITRLLNEELAST
jgi:ribose transport system ATP-binding protein